MNPTSQPSAVGPHSESLREEEERRQAFDREMVDAYLRADRSKKRQLKRRWRISQVLSGYLKPWYTATQIFDDLIDSGADHDRVLAIAENYVFYVKRRIAERKELPTPAAALRIVAKEAGEAAVAQLVADQDPTESNRLRADSETRDAIRAKETYLLTLYHDARAKCAHALSRLAQVGDRRWV